MLAEATDTAEPKLFLDFQQHVTYKDNENEEGLLGLAFHPKFKENGQFFVFYTKKDAPPHTLVISRFTRQQGRSEQGRPGERRRTVPTFRRPFWNHNGGTIDVRRPTACSTSPWATAARRTIPNENGQNLSTINGTILRIDVDHKDPGLNYAIPKDNPFVGDPGARGEIWAYGIRNIWRMAFDKQDRHALGRRRRPRHLGRDQPGRRKAATTAGTSAKACTSSVATAMRRRPKYIEPIWEYHHDIGRSITGGFVYRGKNVPQLDGWYLYADYIRGTVWALKYDESSKKLLADPRDPGQRQPRSCRSAKTKPAKPTS